MKQVYLDYSATTPVKEAVLNEMLPYFSDMYGNPSSIYNTGVTAKEGLDKARLQLSKLINCEPREIVFTSCGSEADNWVIERTAELLKDKGNHIITTKIEHPAIIRTCEHLEKNGYEVTYLDVDEQGFVYPADLKKAIKDTTILISIMMINNEIGTLEPIKELAAVAKEANIYFHTDAVQGLGNVHIDVKDLNVDFMSMSAHKIYGPKGIGALYIKKGIKIPKYIFGGEQENKRRAGTENVAGIVGFGKAAELALENLDNHIEHCQTLRDYFWQEIEKNIDEVYLNGPKDVKHPGNLNVSFNFVEGEAILLMLDNYGISVSTGSACSSKSLVPSHVLDAIGVSVLKMNGTVRFTIGDFTTKNDIDYTVEALIKVIKLLRDLSPVNSEEGW